MNLSRPKAGRPAESCERRKQNVSGAFDLIVTHREQSLFEELSQALVPVAADAAQLAAHTDNRGDYPSHAAFPDALEPSDQQMPVIVENLASRSRGQSAVLTAQEGPRFERRTA